MAACPGLDQNQLDCFTMQVQYYWNLDINTAATGNDIATLEPHEVPADQTEIAFKLIEQPCPSGTNEGAICGQIVDFKNSAAGGMVSGSDGAAVQWATPNSADDNQIWIVESYYGRRALRGSRSA